MAQNLVSLAEAKLSQRIDSNDDDDAVSMYLEAAVSICEDYVGAKFVEESSNGGVLFTPALKAAVLLVFGALYVQREDIVIAVSVSQMPMGARAIMQPYRLGLGV